MTAFYPTTNGIPPIRQPATEILRSGPWANCPFGALSQKHRTPVQVGRDFAQGVAEGLAAPAARPGLARFVPVLRHRTSTP
jgi:hypothetical protein